MASHITTYINNCCVNESDWPKAMAQILVQEDIVTYLFKSLNEYPHCFDNCIDSYSLVGLYKH